MATHRGFSPAARHDSHSTPEPTPRPSSVSARDEEHYRLETGTSTQQSGIIHDTGSISDYTIVPTEEEREEETHGRSSTNQDGTVEVNLSQAEKNHLLDQPLGRVSTLKQWNLEFTALLASVIASTIMVILLVVSDGKPQPDWAYSVSINTLVAIVATLIRTAILFIMAEIVGQAKWSWIAVPRPLRHVEHFDNAGRGAWGSLKFLLFIRKPTATVLSALVVIASYATGPLSQQAVKTYTCEVSAEGIARIAISERTVTVDSRQDTGLLSPQMSTVAINGLLGIPPDVSQLYHYDSGNCLFDDVAGITQSSVGVCSKCTDVRSELQEFDRFGKKKLGRYQTDYRFHNSSSFGINSYVEPTLLNVTTSSNLTVGTSFLTLSVADCVPRLNEEAQVNRYCEHDYKHMPKLSSDVDIVAANCSLRPCLRHYHGNITNGTLNEQLVSTDGMKSVRRSLISEYVAVIQPCLINGKWYDSSNLTNAPRNGIDWTQWTADANQTKEEAPSHCVKSLQIQEFAGIMKFLQRNLKGSCKLYDSFGDESTSSNANNTIGNNSILECSTGWWIDALYSGGKATFEGFAEAHDNMATMITNRMRVNGLTWSEAKPASSYKEGTCRQASICLSIQKWWLLYPTALLALASALLVAAYVQSCRDIGRQPIWKSSILPLLFYSISEEHSSDERHEGRDISVSVPLLQLVQMESRANKTIVSFGDGDEGARFLVDERVIEAK
ncbi:hypothetical protein CNYM01_07887 [Colletotrichum nymphaeae SA-01]|uniref:Uncharacterized protein n=1 Tax=Colletotrichum nymphaeae SA-01 TaxID=1460502 RepID=A0A135UX17_9PEZI|nr:hypothetical protein CNYM01_07887 [Colletotrichum nymphaeae SA-01]